MINEINYQSKNDLELVELTLKNQEYFLYIIKKYETKLFNYIRRISNLKTEDIEDVLQDVFIKIYKNLNDFDGNLKFSSWIYRITHNQVISEYRKNKNRPHYNTVDIDKIKTIKLADNLDIKKEIDNKILRKNIFKILNKLNIKHKEILILKFVEEKNYQEMSDILEKPMGTIASLMNRAKKEFRKEYLKKELFLK